MNKEELKNKIVKEIEDHLQDYNHEGEDLVVPRENILEIIEWDNGEVFFGINDLQLPTENITRYSDGFTRDEWDWTQEFESGWELNFRDIEGFDRKELFMMYYKIC